MRASRIRARDSRPSPGGAEARTLLQGELLWGSGFVLASWLATSGFARARRVLELGSGLGLGGLAAAALGASEVVLTDRPGPVLDALRLNATLNCGAAPCAAPISVAALDWSEGSPGLGTFEAIVGADLIYDRASCCQLLAVLRQHLRSGGAFACVDPGREGGARAEFRALVAAELPEWRYTEVPLRDAAAASGLVEPGCRVPLPPCRRHGLAAALGLPLAALSGSGVAVRDIIAADTPYTLITLSEGSGA